MSQGWEANNPVRPQIKCELVGDVMPLERESMGDLLPDMEFNDEEEGEALRPAALRDPGAPSATEIGRHNITHMPFRAWCSACVAGRARDRPHHHGSAPETKGVPEIVFDYAFVGSSDEDENLAILVVKDRRTRLVVSHVVPRQGVVHDHLADLRLLVYNEVILKCDGEPALKAVQEEVKRRFEGTAICENSPVGDSRANGAAERNVQAVGEMIRVVRRGLEDRVGASLPGKHAVTAWLVEHVGDLISRYQVGDDGRTGYERHKGKPYTREAIEFGEKKHYRRNKKQQSRDWKLEVNWGEGHYLGTSRRTGEAIIGTQAGVIGAGTIRRMGAHRRWDRESPQAVVGLPWQRKPNDPREEADAQARWVDHVPCLVTDPEETEAPARRRLILRREDFFKLGFTEGCAACRAIIHGHQCGAHSESCRSRMEKELREGRRRLERERQKLETSGARKREEEELTDNKRKN